jgi:amino acid adenylation domain-containing protein
MSDLEIITFLNRLEKSDVKLSLEGENLGVVFAGEQDDVLLGEIRQHKSSLLRFLQNAATPANMQVMHVDHDNVYALAHSQKRIWLHDKLEPGNRAYYIHSDVLIKGPMEMDMLECALEAVLERHESLRTVFTQQKGEPVQQVLPSSEVWAGLRETHFHKPYDERFLDKIFAERKAVKFDIETGPLFALHLFRFDNDVQVLSFAIHHIIADAQSLAVFMTELITKYQQLQSGISFTETLSQFQYRDFCDWEEKQRNSPSFKKDREYWMRQFSEEPVAITLPYKTERKNFKTYNGQVHESVIERSLMESVRRFCREQKTTPFTFFYASLQALLYRYTEQNDLTIGTSVQGRDQLAFRDQIGLYASTLPLRLRFAEHASFLQLFEAARTTVQDALSHHHYPFDLLVQECAFVRDPSRAPFFDIMIDYFPAVSMQRVNGIEFSPVKFPHTTSKFDLTFTFFDDSEEVKLRVEYNTDLFDEQFMRSMWKHYRQLLQQVLQAPHAAVYKLPMLEGDEINHLISTLGCGPDEIRPFNSISSLFEKVAARMPANEAVACNGNMLSYADINSRANRLAHYIQERLSQPQGQVVAVMLERSELLIIALMAVAKSGAAFLPVDPNAPSSYCRHILFDSKAALLITDMQSMPSLMDVYAGELFAIDVQLDTLTTADTNPEANIAPDSLAYVLYTSGSTGTPKGVEVMQRNISNYLQWAIDYYYEGLQTTRVPWFTSFTFDLSLTSIFTPVLRGDILEIYPQRDPRDAFMQMLKSNHSFGVMKLTPSHINVLGMAGVQSLQVERVIVGGEELLPAHITILQKASPGVRVFNEYGPTETTVGCTVDEVSAHYITIGRPIANTSIYVLNKAGELMPAGCWGEIIVGGTGVAKGYCNLQQLTASKFLPDGFTGNGRMYRTGDIGRWLPDGRLAYRGRADNQVKINGFRIELGEIENALQNIHGIEKATVLVRHEAAVKSIVAFFAGDKSLDGTALRTKLSDQLPAYMLPTQYVHVDNWPLTPNGKTDTAVLLQLANDTSGRAVNSRMPETEQEKTLAAFFEELLGVERLGVDENLFSVGLDSLKVIKAQSMLEEIYPGKVQIHDIFSQSTIAKLTTHIHGVAKKHDALPEIIDF